ncbi:hypothetical protein TcWFU_003584 [Taenia crassiceps]|uniref:Uncharacterized protein n=1 Tax=Taenia crassiceps TaxID=6207 RepID=A0ABR4Q5G9_9CEST
MTANSVGTSFLLITHSPTGEALCEEVGLHPQPTTHATMVSTSFISHQQLPSKITASPSSFISHSFNRPFAHAPFPTHLLVDRSAQWLEMRSDSRALATATLVKQADISLVKHKQFTTAHFDPGVPFVLAGRE